MLISIRSRSFLFAVTIVITGLVSNNLCFAGGRRCACLDYLEHLDAARVPAVLQPPQKIPEIVAAFDLGDRPITALSFADYGETLVVAESGPQRRGEGSAGRVMLYDLKGDAPRPSGSLDATSDYIGSLADSPMTGEWMASGSVRLDQRLKFWRCSEQGISLVQTIPDFSNWWHRSLAFSHDEGLLATVSGDSAGPVQLWDCHDDGLKRRTILSGPAWAASAIGFSADDRYLATGLGSGHHHPNDGQLLIWDLPDNGRLVQQSHVATASDDANANDVTALTWIGKHHALATADQAGSIAFHRLQDGKLTRIATSKAHPRGVRSIVSIAGDQVLSLGNDGIAVWSSAGERQRQINFGSIPTVMTVAPSRIHVAVGMTNGTVYILKFQGKGEDFE